MTRTIDSPLGLVLLREARFDEILALRHDVLRHGMPIDAAVFPGDDAAPTLHLGAFLGPEPPETVGCATFHLNEYAGRPAFQLRGMATRGDLRRCGIGRAMLLLADELLRARSDVRLLWCNARTPAIGFYEAQGWRVDSEEFVIPTAGPHVRMRREMGEGRGGRG